MKHQILLISLSILMQMAYAQDSDFTIPLSEAGKRGTLIVDIKKGPITIKGTSRQDVYIKYKSTEEDNKNKADVKSGMKRISAGMPGLEAEEQNNKVYIESENWNRGLSLYIEIPRGFDLEINSFNDGDIDIDNVAGKVAIETFNGGISAKNIEGSVVANTYNGPIVVTFSKITAGTPMNFITYNGNVDITLPADTKASFKLKSEQGDIYTDFDMQMSKSTAPEKKESGSKKQLFVSGLITGNINGGGPEFAMQNYNGDIYIRKK
ncbi:MAG: DUF4097 family beta strand repeat-containing protein [Saprospiraceae bacterium]